MGVGGFDCRSLRVVLLAHNLRAAGGLAVGRNVVSALSRVRPGHSYLMFVPSGVGYEGVSLPPNCEVHYFERRRGWTGQFLFESMELPRRVRAYHPDRIWGLGNFGLCGMGCPQAVLIHKPHYVYGPDAQQRERLRFRLLNALGRRRLRKSLPDTALVFCQSRTICDRFRQAFSYSGKVALMPSAVSELVLKGDRGSSPVVFEGLAGKFVLLCVTKYYAHKNLEALVDLMLKHGDELSDVVILLTVEASQHPSAGRFIRRVADDRLKGRLINVGVIQPSELAGYFAGCAGLILPTLLETFGLPYLEAMQFDKPILTSDLDFARDVCGPAARYFDPLDTRSIRDAILEVKSSSELRDRLVAAGRERMRSYFRDWDSIVAEAMSEIEALGEADR